MESPNSTMQKYTSFCLENSIILPSNSSFLNDVSLLQLSQNEEYFCVVEFGDSIRIMAKMMALPKKDQIVKISKCGISEESYFFQVI